VVLKALRLHGFKSFAEEVEILFPGRVVGIIGPNGCGKSNVVDAVRFVLGEQSLRLLRARKIDDLLFAGNVRRPATSFGSVGLVLDNANRWLDIDYPEVEIRRIMHRDGESKYTLNGTGVRLKDIQKLFMDVGVNKGHYSVIGQGQVQSIVSASPEERRQYFEEAAGVVSYRQSRRETLRRLDEVQKNMEQAATFTAEYESRMHGLKVQAGRAQKYLEYQTAYRQLFLFSAWRRHHLIRQEMETIQGELALLEQELAAVERADAETADRESALTSERSNRLAELSERQDQLQKAEDQRVERDRAVILAEEKSYGLGRSLNELDLLENKLSRQTEDLFPAGPEPKESLRFRIEQMKKEFGVAIEQQEDRAHRLQAELESVDARLQAEEARMEIGQAGIISARESIAALESTLAGLQQSSEEIRVRLEQLGAQCAADDARMSNLKADLEKRERRRAECGQVQTETEVLTREAERWLERSMNSLNQLRRDAAEIQGRYHHLCAAEESHEGFSASVRMVLDRFGKRDEFLGVVRDLITFEPEYTKAVEAALGPKLQHMVVQSGESVKDILRELSRDLRGRVTFWALDLLPPPIHAPAIDLNESTIGWAVSLLKFDPKLRRLFENLLGRTLVVRDMEALLLAAKTWGGRSAIVTIEGAYYRSGAITAGPTVGAILMNRKRDLSETEIRLRGLTDRLAVEEEQHTRACSEVAAARTAREAAYRRYKEADAEVVRAEADLQSVLLVARERKSQMEKTSEQLTHKLAAMSETRDRYDQIQLKAGQEEVQDRRLLDELRSHIQSLRTDQSAALSELRTLEEKQRDLTRIDAELLDLESRRQAIGADKQTAEDSVRRFREDLTRAEEASAGCRAAMKESQSAYAAIGQQIEQIRAESGERMRRSQQKREEVHRRQIRQTELGADRSNLRENVLNELPDVDIEQLTDPPATPAGADGRTAEDCVAETRDLQLRMQKLGAVNIHAIEEYNDVAAKHADLARQVTDLEQAKENLKDVLRKTDRICRDRFGEVFERVATYYQEVTKKLFLGGEGKLILTESDDLMESGVDIQIRPPGKGFTSIASRSGGEQSLAGLCLLFALFMEKPSPFCMLDEVDAALDDVNVGRLVRLIEDFSERIQFVIVTHNKLTMQSAGCLFGATMEEAGITKFVSVRMKTAEQQALAAAS